MKIRKCFLIILFAIFFISISNSQSSVSKDTIYIDEFNKLSDKDLTLKKCKSDVFYCRVMQYDSLIAYHVKYKYRFGKMEKEEKDAVFKSLDSFPTKSIDLDKKTIINYGMYVFSYDDYMNYLDSTEQSFPEHLKLTRRRFYTHLNQRNKLNIKCIKKVHSINKANMYYAYSHNYGRTNAEVFPKVQLRSETLKSKFFNGQDQFHLLILHPDGHYFQKTYKTSNADFSQDDVWELVKNDDWQPYLIEWERRKKLLVKSKPNVYINTYPKFKHCF